MNTCEHQACNSTTDYELIKCTNKATHRISWPDGASSIACETHVRHYLDILDEMNRRNTVRVHPDFVRLEP